MERKKNSRFEIIDKLGEGSFSKMSIFILGKVYKAFDKISNRDVALKVEKDHKSKKILKFEFEILKDLQGKLYF